MACQVLTETLAASISFGSTSQPHAALKLRRTRTRKTPSRSSPENLSTPQRDTASHKKVDLSIKLEALGPHRSISTSLQSTTSSSTTSMDSGMRLTKTGRISKAQKGVRGAHSCGCGKVSLLNLLHQLPLLMHLLGVLHCLSLVPLQPAFPRALALALYHLKSSHFSLSTFVLVR